MTIPTSMRAVVLTGHGGYERLEFHQDWPTPVAAAGEVLVKVTACGLNNTDINTRSAWYSKTVTTGLSDISSVGEIESVAADQGSWSGSRMDFPRIQGADVAGRIAAVGAGVDSARIGERVILDPWIFAGSDSLDPARCRYFGSECDGGFAEYTTIVSQNAIRIETPLSDVELATYPCAYTTAENLISRTGLRPGESVAICGASGGVGSAAIQLCRLRGAQVIAIASPAKAEILQRHGANQVIDRDQVNLEAALREAAGGPIDVALDVVGGSAFTPLINALCQGGRYSSSGAIAGPLVEFDLRQLVYKDLQLTGATIAPAGTMHRLVKLIEQGQLPPRLAQCFPLKDLYRAQETFMQKQHTGKIVVEL